jgi:hypothetical protein
MVEFTFATTELRGICENRRRAAAAIGVQAAHELATVADLASLFAGNIIERSPLERSIRLKTGYDLVFRAGHVKVPQTSSGALDWAKVSRIKFIALEATDG